MHGGDIKEELKKTNKQKKQHWKGTEKTTGSMGQSMAFF